MRRIVMFNHVSADGYFATPDGKLDWVVQDADLGRDAMTSSGEIDTVLFGRRTYDMFESFWPNVLTASPTAPDPHGGAPSREARAMATMLNDAAKWVFSRTRTQVTWNNSHLVPELEPRAVEAMKREPGKDMIVFGSSSIVSQLTQHGLIDEYQLVVAPVFLGAGRPLLRELPQLTRLQLLEARPYRTGNVLLRYARAGA